MKKSEIDEMAMRVFDELSEKEDKIMQKAKREGRWLPGLDSNEYLFKEVKREAWDKIQELAKLYDAADE